MYLRIINEHLNTWDTKLHPLQHKCRFSPSAAEAGSADRANANGSEENFDWLIDWFWWNNFNQVWAELNCLDTGDS